MFESYLIPRVCPWALDCPYLDANYYQCWIGLRSHFSSNNRSENGSPDVPGTTQVLSEDKGDAWECKLWLICFCWVIALCMSQLCNDRRNKDMHRRQWYNKMIDMLFVYFYWQNKWWKLKCDHKFDSTSRSQGSILVFNQVLFTFLWSLCVPFNLYLLYYINPMQCSYAS